MAVKQSDLFPAAWLMASLLWIFGIGAYTNTLARASAPALPMKALDGWKATSYMDSSDFFRWEVTSCTHVLLSRFHSRIEQSWPVQDNKKKLLSTFSNDSCALDGSHPFASEFKDGTLKYFFNLNCTSCNLTRDEWPLSLMYIT